ncbi:DNA recombination protein RmuC [Mesorhizobium sp. CA15]|uniref:DNA recombination protein RmuC n=1 Tax=Mesorhizobium sp. CA15 TaxID=2876641 RepID=UPI001CD11FC7|nr:DNA recombination protein RmuC [Mesorhizobium sp. CA15]MBZ9864220.1 DNA recombination protein RmuC [Mesorhizobium sp. CA15]
MYNIDVPLLAAIASALACVLSLIALFYLGIRINHLKGFALEPSQFEQGIEKLQSASREDSRNGREELHQILARFLQLVESRLATLGTQQNEQLGALRKEASDGRTALETGLKQSTDAFSDIQARRLGETNQAMKELAERLEKAHVEARRDQKDGLEAVATQIKSLTDSNEKKQESIREALNSNLEHLRKENEAKLEQMRLTVDEKLQGTLETRLGESFKIVSDRLELVHKGLGEMQTLATGVGDLKRVLTNVKSRGGWGEMQLEMILQDLLTVDQYAKNVRINPDSNEVVEFAIRLPGKNDDAPVYLPIDAKFPQEDYERLLAAQDVGTPVEIEAAGLGLERAIRLQAKTISDKYLHPPHSTDFAIMYLPTEGLFAEAIRRPGLGADIQSKYRVVLTGPTTLAALLTSLQMGFRTLAIEKRSSEVWQVLGAAKAEFRKYGEVWNKLGKQLDTAKRTVEDAGRRTRALERKLRDVETVELPDFHSELYDGAEEEQEVEPSEETA